MRSTVQQIMSTHPLTVRYRDDLSIAHLRMKREKVRHLPVIDDDGNLVGIISDRDFQRAMWSANGIDAHGLPEGAVFRKGAKVSEFMSCPVKAVSDDTDLLVAVNMMIDQKISAVVVTKSDQIAGIITHEDLLKVLAIHLREPTPLKEKVMAFAYNSPMGQVAELLAGAGI